MSSQKRKEHSLTSIVIDNGDIKGAQLFRNLQLLKVEEQVRCRDPQHMAIINKMTSGQRLSMADFEPYKPLSAVDVSPQGDFGEVPILVATHRERYTFTHHQAKVFAQRHKVHVIRFPRKIHFWLGRPLDVDSRQDAQLDPAFWEYYVHGAPAYITANIMKRLALVNGLEVVMDMLVPASAAQALYLGQCMRDTPFGEVISLVERPAAINVRINGLDGNAEWAEFTQDDAGVVVLPLFPHNGRKLKVGIPAGMTYTASKVQVVDGFPVELAFAITIHKAQGRTMTRIVLALSERGDPIAELSYAHLYVGLSRVREAECIRFLLCMDLSGELDYEALIYLTALEPDRAIRAYFMGFTLDGSRWDVEQALVYFNSMGE
jgi:hypothetical protein